MATGPIMPIMPDNAALLRPQVKDTIQPENAISVGRLHAAAGP